jgi:hypothetical protein
MLHKVLAQPVAASTRAQPEAMSTDFHATFISRLTIAQLLAEYLPPVEIVIGLLADLSF